MFGEFMRFAGQNILHRRLRSWLTVIGVFIGITAVVALISFGLGLEETVNEQIRGVFGDTEFIVMDEQAFGPAHGSGDIDQYAVDLDYVLSVDGVRTAAVVATRNGAAYGPIQPDGSRTAALREVTGLSTELVTEFAAFIGDLELVAGRGFEEGETQVAILGPGMAEDLGVTVGDVFLIGGDVEVDYEFEVVGILATPEEDSDSGGFGFSTGLDRDGLYVPFEAMGLLWPNDNSVLLTLVAVNAGEDVQEIADTVEEELNDRGASVTAITYQDISDVVGTMTSAIFAFLAGIAGISLLVGAVGVMNTMFTSVLERTKEIGIMKSVGAKNVHVWAIFLIESGLIGLVGGIVGTLAGLALDAAGSAIVGSLTTVSLSVVVSPSLIVFTLLGSFLLGAVAGLWPAWRASRLPVVDALRYE